MSEPIKYIGVEFDDGYHRYRLSTFSKLHSRWGWELVTLDNNYIAVFRGPASSVADVLAALREDYIVEKGEDAEERYRATPKDEDEDGDEDDEEEDESEDEGVSTTSERGGLKKKSGCLSWLCGCVVI